MPKVPKAIWKLTENMSSEKEENRSQYIGLAKKFVQAFHSVIENPGLFGQPNLVPQDQMPVLCFAVESLGASSSTFLPSTDEAQGPWNGGQSLSQMGQIYPAAWSPISICPSSSSHTGLLCVIRTHTLHSVSSAFTLLSLTVKAL